MNISPLNDTYSNKLSTLLSNLEPEFIELKKLLKKFKMVDTSYKNGFSFLLALANTHAQHQHSETSTEHLTEGVIRQFSQTTELFNAIIKDEEASEAYINAGLFNELLDYRERLVHIIANTN